LYLLSFSVFGHFSALLNLRKKVSVTMRSFLTIFTQAFVLTALLLSILAVSAAQVRTSSSYRLESDSINFGGGQSSSTNYELESTAGEIATGPSDSPTYKLKAGYQQMQEVFISLTDATDVVMAPTIGGLTGGVSNGSTSVSVLTDSPSGYQLSIKAESAPAMVKGVDSITDYVPVASPAADYNFTTGSNDVHFGFSPEGADIVTYFRNSGTTCGTGAVDDTLSCWVGLSTSEIIIAQGSANQPTGATTTLNFRVGIGGGVPVLAGDYIATTTLTAIPL
jgi:hypothetical protein